MPHSRLGVKEPLPAGMSNIRFIWHQTQPGCNFTLIEWYEIFSVMKDLILPLVATLVRVFFCFFLFPKYLTSVGTVGTEFLFDNYYEIALSLLAGNGFLLADGTVVFHRPPLYPILLTLPLALSPGAEWHISAMQLFNCLLGGLSVYFTILATRIITNKDSKAPLVAGLLVAFWPFGIWITRVTITENLLMALVPLTLFCAVRYIKGNQRRFGIGAGALLGLLCLTHSSYLAFAMGMILAVLIGRNFKIALPQAGLILLAAVVVVSPWTLRNHSHGFTGISTATGFGLHYFKGWYYFENLIGPGEYFKNLEVESVIFANSYIVEAGASAIHSDADRSDIEKMKQIDTLAIDHLLENPGLNAIKVSLKAPLMWVRQQSPARAVFNALLLIPLLYFAIVAVRQIGISTSLLFFIPLMSLTAAFSLVFIEDAPMRYALPLFPLLGILAGVGACSRRFNKTRYLNP